MSSRLKAIALMTATCGALEFGLTWDGALAQISIYSPSMVFRPTIHKVELSRDGGSAYVTLASGPLSVDVASVGAGSRIATYLSNASTVLYPSTTYDRVRLTLGCGIGVKGNITDPGTGTIYYTTSSGGTTTSGPAAEGTFNIGANYASYTSTCTSASQNFEQVIPTSLTTDGDGGLSFTIKFDEGGLFLRFPSGGTPTLSFGNLPIYITQP